MNNPIKIALLTSIAKLDEEAAEALYNALAAHIENEDEHIELLSESQLPGEAKEAKVAAKALAGIKAVVDACEVAICELASDEA